MSTTHRSSGTAWVIPALAALTAIAWAGWAAMSAMTNAAAAATHAPVSAGDALQQEIIRSNLRAPGDAGLGAMYADINTRFYHGTLPVIPVRWDSRMAEVGKLSGDRFTLEGLFGHVGRDRVILLNPSLQPDRPALERALCHEIVHAYISSTGDESTNHGPTFQAELRRLAEGGAFEGMPATDEERTTLRAWLNTESARLSAERDDMARLGGDLELERADIERDVAAANASAAAGAASASEMLAKLAARRDAYNARAAEATQRADRDQSDQDHFNHEAARYNLMLVYPDGLDESDAGPWKNNAVRHFRQRADRR